MAICRGIPLICAALRQPAEANGCSVLPRGNVQSHPVALCCLAAMCRGKPLFCAASRQCAEANRCCFAAPLLAAEDGEEVGALLDAAGLKSCVPGRSPEPQEATEPPAPDPALAAALEHEDWEGAEDKERRAPAS
eukprot:scaffold40890_cov17-Tisochrysis_lutea.AAC.1